VILSDNKDRYSGTLKFFDEKKKFGFLVMDKDGSDIFVHYEDLNKVGLTTEQLMDPKFIKDLKFTFCELEYLGKHRKSKKAVDLKMIKTG